jgi:hypothetical protein
LNPLEDDVIASVLAYHARRAAGDTGDIVPSVSYRAESLDVLFSKKPS